MTRPALSLDEFSSDKLRKIKAVFFDIDDTFSLHGKIYPEAYEALWRLSKSGISTVPVTGRPAGWCDFISRMWPVTAVVGENGAFYQYLRPGKPPKLIKKYLESEKVRNSNARRLLLLKKKIHRKFKGLTHPSDQAFREFDLAVDTCEDVKAWPEKKVQELIKFCEDEGAIAKLSSIHVNIWYGRYDKWTCVQKVLAQHLKIKDLSQLVYLGDSPNDEPFFKAAPLSVGVSNVRSFLPKMQHHPKFITKNPGGFGFAEFANHVLKARL